MLYVDEAGCLGVLPLGHSSIQPVFVVTGLIIDSSAVPQITQDFLKLKRRFFPGLCTSNHLLDDILPEVKGANLRKNIASGGRNVRRAAAFFLGEIVKLLSDHDAKLISRIWIKPPGAQFDSLSVYTFSIQSLCDSFQKHLSEGNDSGFIVADSRSKDLNSKVSHSIFAQKFGSKESRYSSILELPMFGHSDNHSGIQLADLVCSAILFPTAIETYCKGHISNTHVRDYSALKKRFMSRIESMQYRYQTTLKRWKGGVTVSDGLNQRSGAHLFK